MKEGSLLSDRAPAHSSRAAGVAGAILLQFGFFLLFLASMPSLTLPVAPGRELVFTLPRLVPVVPQPAPSKGPARGSRTAGPSSVQPFVFPAMPQPQAQPDMQAFGRAFNDCAPQDYQSLPPEEKARCRRPGEGAKFAEVPDLMGSPSRVQDEAYWEAALAHKKSPTWLPCTGPMTTATQVSKAPAPGISFVCIATMLAVGTLTDPRSWPTYETQQFGAGDFYKIEQAYDEWHKAHPDHAPPPALGN